MSSLGPRFLAIKTLFRWLRCHRKRRPPLESVIEEAYLEYGELNSKDRALVREIVTGVVRNLTLLEWLISRYLKNKGKIDLTFKAALMVGAYQILFLKKVPDHAALNETVEATRRLLKGRSSRGSGFVNAVLRRIVKEKKNITESYISELTPDIRYSHPEWIVKRWNERLGLNQTISILKANNEPPPVTLRVNLLRCNREELIRLLEDHGIKAIPGNYSPQAVLLDGHFGDIRRLPGFKEGYFQVQDEGAQLIGFLVDPQPGEVVLDACAGLGGKSTHLVELSRGRATIYACEKSVSRKAVLSENLKRLGMVSHVKILEEGDCLRAFSKGNKVCFDKILLDAPCSGLGVIRRHPDIKWNRVVSDITQLRQLQMKLLQGLKSLVSVKGKLIYATCTLEPEETTLLVEDFLKNNPSWELMDPSPFIPRSASGVLIKKHFFYATPPKTDGFFGAVLRRVK